MTDKAHLRRELRRRRAALSHTIRRRAEIALAKRASRLIRRGMQIGVYLAAGSELSLSPLINMALKRGALAYVPIVPTRGRLLRFARFDATQSRWQRNCHGIAEPLGARTIKAQRFDLVFFPLVGFDEYGTRLGQGGGYYDYTFSFRTTRLGNKKPTLIGVGFDCQRAPRLPRDTHDVVLDRLLTPTGFRRPNHR